MANRKLFGTEIGLTTNPATTKRIAVGDTSTTVLNMTMGALRTWILNEIPAPEFLTKVVNVGALSMDSNSSDTNKDIALGVARNKIRSCQVLILSNDGGLYPLAMPAGNKEMKSYWWIRQEATYASNARVHIYSEGSNVNRSFFNQGAFSGNGPSGNRGYIYVTYIA